jgi:hypothetical protein
MNKYILVLLLIVGAFVAGYFYKDEKIITKVETKIEYVKVEGKTVVVTKPDGSSISTTDFVSNTTANSTSKEKTIINPKHIILTGLYSPSSNSHNFGAILTYDFLGRVGLGGGVVRANNANLGLLAISFKF